MMGNIPFEYGDYLIIPRGVIYQIDFDTAVNRLLSNLRATPKRYKNESGQHLEHAPFVSVILFCQRSWRLMMKGDFIKKLKKKE
jgi:homogentisate 1,2-dioxygenase